MPHRCLRISHCHGLRAASSLIRGRYGLRSLGCGFCCGWIFLLRPAETAATSPRSTIKPVAASLEVFFRAGAGGEAVAVPALYATDIEARGKLIKLASCGGKLLSYITASPPGSRPPKRPHRSP